MSTAAEPQTQRPAPGSTAISVAASVVRLYNAFLQQPDLSPSATINTIFGELVELCIQPYDATTAALILSDKRIAKFSGLLRSICSTGEYKLESYWATRMLAARTQNAAEAVLRSFPYCSNYVDLSRLEISALAAVHPMPISSLAFIGSGPLPMTSLCFATLLNPPPERIHNIDCDPHAIDVSSRLCEVLGAKTLTFQLADAADLAAGDLQAFDVVFLAGLVGESEEAKMQILESVVARCKEDTLVVLRSAHGVRRLLYQAVEVGALHTLGLEVLLVVHPWNHVVNSVIVTKVVGKRNSSRARL